MDDKNKNIYTETPLVFSKYLSDVISKQVYLKLENTQPSGSFKLRGISELCKQKIKDGCKKFVGSSGGNAGLAMAYVAYQLQVPCQLFVPTYVSQSMLKKIKAFGAEVTIIGDDFKMANAEALKVVELNPEIGFIHPYDHPAIWDGNSSLVEEIKIQLNGVKPTCIVTAVGGGGLLLGILKGLQKTDWEDVRILAIETVGSECFHKSIKAGEIVEIEITSVARSLGASSVAPNLMKIYPDFSIISKVLSDNQAVNASLRFAEEHQYLVEPACGAALASVYEKLVPRALNENGLESNEDDIIVVVVCGGSDCTPQQLTEWSRKLEILNN